MIQLQRNDKRKKILFHELFLYVVIYLVKMIMKTSKVAYDGSNTIILIAYFCKGCLLTSYFVLGCSFIEIKNVFHNFVLCMYYRTFSRYISMQKY